MFEHQRSSAMEFPRSTPAPDPKKAQERRDFVRYLLVRRFYDLTGNGRQDRDCEWTIVSLPYAAIDPAEKENAREYLLSERLLTEVPKEDRSDSLRHFRLTVEGRQECEACLRHPRGGTKHFPKRAVKGVHRFVAAKHRRTNRPTASWLVNSSLSLGGVFSQPVAIAQVLWQIVRRLPRPEQ